MSEPPRLRWAIAGTGNIARRFAEDMRLSKLGRIVAVASANPDRASSFAAAVGDDVAHGDLDAILTRPDVDAVYIASRNDLHCDHALRCIAAGRPVLVEKPFATSVGEAKSVADAARNAGLLVMEAMWMRFIPAVGALRARVERGDVGDIRTIEASLSFNNPRPAASPLADLGVYPISLVVQMLGAPTSLTATATSDGMQVGLLLAYPAAVALLSCGFAAEGRNAATIAGTKGVLQVDRPLFAPTMISLRHTGSIRAPTTEGPLAALPRFSRRDASRNLLAALRRPGTPVLYNGNGLRYQADHFAQCLRNGVTDSPVMPLEETIEVIRIVEAAEASLRDQASKRGGPKVDTGL